MSSYISEFNYQILGPDGGHKWVFLHGLMGFGLNWRRIASDLTKSGQNQALIFDQRGHGRSMKPLTGYAPDDFADDLHLITDELGWNRFFLVGHSMGGRNAVAFAHKFPQKVEKLVIEDIGPEGDADAPAYYQWLLNLVPTPFSSKLQAKEFFMNEFPKLIFGKTENPDTLGSFLYTNLEDKPDGTVDWRFHKEAIILSVLQGRAKDFWQEFRALPMETLIIRGEASSHLSRAVFERMKVSNPRISGVEISNAGHWVHSEQPEQFLAAIRLFTQQS